MAIPKINPTDLFSTVVDKINDAIDQISTTFTRVGKTLTITKEDGTSTITVDLSASPNGVVSGIVVTQDATDQRKFLNTLGVVKLNEEEVNVTAQAKTTASGDPANPRIDLLILNASGFLTFVTGTPAAIPIPPALPETSLLLGFVYVEAGATDTVNNVYFQPVNPAGSGLYEKFDGSSVTITGGGTIPDAPAKADQAQTDAGTDDEKYITPLKFANSTTKTASQPETDTGTNDLKYITPLKLANYSGFPQIANSYIEKFDLLTPTSAAMWHSIAAGVGNDKVVLISITNTGGAARVVGVREVGSSLNRSFDIANGAVFTTIAKTDGSGDLEVYTENIGQTVFDIIAILG